MVRRWYSWAPILLIGTLLVGCGAKAGTTASSAPQSEAANVASSGGAAAPSMPITAPVAEAPGATDQDKAASSTQPSAENQALVGRMVIRTAKLTLAVDKVDGAEAQARALVQSGGGYVLSSATSGDSDDRTVHLTLKVPADRFDSILSSLEGLAKKVRDRTVTGEDVTDEYVDTESRLRNLHATEARLLDFLKDAKTVDEALQVNQQLTDLQGQIEQLNGRIQVLKQSTAYSTIDVDLLPVTTPPSLAEDGWTPLTAATAAWDNLLAFGQQIADLIIVLAIWSPVWGIALLALILVWRRFNRRPPPPAPTTLPSEPTA